MDDLCKYLSKESDRRHKIKITKIFQPNAIQSFILCAFDKDVIDKKLPKIFAVISFEALVRTNSFYEKPTVVFSPHTHYARVRLARFTREDHASCATEEKATVL